MNELQLIYATLTAAAAALGAVMASFINAQALRALSKRNNTVSLSQRTGRSHCPGCGRQLRWFELVPIVSWTVQAGRCRSCKMKIPPRYVLAEIIGATVSALCFVRHAYSLLTPAALIISSILLAVAVYDMTMMEVPDILHIALIPLAIISIWLDPGVTPVSRAIGVIVVSLPMLALALVIDGAFGGADIKLMAVCGALLGWRDTLLAFFIAVLLAGGVSLARLINGKAHMGAKLPLCPYLCTGVFTAMLYGGHIINWYLRLYNI